MSAKQFGVPLAVRLRAYIPHALCALCALAVYVILLLFTAQKAAGDCARIKRVSTSPVNEIVYSYGRNEGEVFYYLRETAVAGANGNAVSDVFMTMPDVEYGNNCIYFSGSLQKGTCAVSENIAVRYGLNVGDYAKVIGTDVRLTVARVLPAQDGLDEDYKHEGIIVLAYDAELLDGGWRYVSFGTDGDAYYGLDRLLRVDDLDEGCAARLCAYAAVATAVVAAVAVLCERFLFRARRADYSVLVAAGMRLRRLFATVLADNFIKYLVPSVAVSTVFGVAYGYYGICILLPLAFFVAVNALACAVYSAVAVRSLYYVAK